MDGHIRFSPYKSADADANFTKIADADVKKTAGVPHLRISDTSLAITIKLRL